MRESNAHEILIRSIDLDSAMNAPRFKENICFECGREAHEPLTTMRKKDRIKRLCVGCHIGHHRTLEKNGWIETKD